MFNVGKDVSWAYVDPTMYQKKNSELTQHRIMLANTMAQHCLVNANLYPTPLYTTTNGPSQVMLTG